MDVFYITVKRHGNRLSNVESLEGWKLAILLFTLTMCKKGILKSKERANDIAEYNYGQGIGNSEKNDVF